MKIRWRAKYSDGKHLDQIDGTSVYPNIDRTKLAAFDIIDIDRIIPKSQVVITDDKTQLLFRMFLDKGQRLIYRKRVLMDVGTSEAKSIVYMVGYQEKIRGVNKQVINYIFEDGHVEQAGQWQGGEPALKDYEVKI